MLKVLASVDDVLASHQPPPPPKDTVDTPGIRALADKLRRVPRLRPKQEQAFRALWWYNLPIVVYGLETSLQLDCWTPEAFIASHGHELCTMRVSGRAKPAKVTVAEFFHEFQKDDDQRDSVVRMKVSGYSSVACRRKKKQTNPPRTGRRQRTSRNCSSSNSQC